MSVMWYEHESDYSLDLRVKELSTDALASPCKGGSARKAQKQTQLSDRHGRESSRILFQSHVDVYWPGHGASSKTLSSLLQQHS